MRRTARSLAAFVQFPKSFAGVVAPFTNPLDLCRAIVALSSRVRKFVRQVAVHGNRRFGRVAINDKAFVGQVFDVLEFNGGAC